MTPTLNSAETVGMNVAQFLRLGGVVTIASIFPMEQFIERRFRTRQRPDGVTTGGFHTRYTLPAAPMDGKVPSVMTIADAMEYVYLGEKRWEEVPVAGGAHAIATDFIRNTRECAVDQEAGACPGIWICADSKGPSDSEIALAKRWQTNYFTRLQLQADNAWIEGKREKIGSLHRVAAEWLHLDPRKHEWIKPPERGEVVKCPFCTTDISADAIKCSQCNEIVDPVRYAERIKAVEEAKAALAAVGVKPIETQPDPAAGIKAPIHPPLNNPARK